MADGGAPRSVSAALSVTGSSRPSSVRVDLSAIGANARFLLSRVPAGTRLMAVVKADGYGHGAVAVARAALACGAAMLGVATVPEGGTLRAAGIAAPVVVLGPTVPAEIPAILRCALIPAVMDAAFCALLGEAATAAGSAPFPVHVKVDTGMHRYGVPVADAPALLQRLTTIAGVRVAGVFTHFATADVPNDPFLAAQATRFAAFIAAIERAGLRPPVVHAANSGAILQGVAPWEMVRAGIALYGVPPAPEIPAEGLTPAMSVHTAIARVIAVPRGGSVGYGRRWIADAPARAALLPIGYADGVARSLTNRGAVLIGGRRCPLIGTVSMDQCVALLPDDLAVAVGEPVVIVGTQGAAVQTLTALGAAAGTISYELAVRFGARLARVYHESSVVSNP